MVRFKWDEQNIRWYLDAAANTGFHKTLAQSVLPYLDQGATLCDIGCGLGRLDLEIAPYVSALTAVDINKNAINILKRDAEALRLHNLHTCIHDAKTLDGDFDVLLMSFFGQPNMPDFQKLRCRKIIRIINTNNNSRFYPERHKCREKATVADVSEELNANGAVYKLELHAIEFGQPLRSLRDAELFVKSNAPEAENSEICEFLNENIVRTGREDFPFYLPNMKELGIFVINAEE